MRAIAKIKIMYKLFLKNLINISSKPLYQIIAIFLLALLLRVFRLGEYPVGFHVDEVKVGWNALSILKTFRDDQGNFLPLYYNTFGDYRPTGIFYLSIPAIAIFGNTIFAVRITSALIGALTIIPLYLLAKELFKKDSVGVYSALILAVSPWHIETSRATSEVVISGFFIVLIIYLSIINKKIILNLFAIILSYFLYHSSRLLLPIYLTTLFLTKNINKYLLLLSISLTIILSFGSASRARLNQVSIFNSENVKYELKRSNEPKLFVYTRSIIKEYGKYFSSDFLIGESAKPYRYLTLGVGLLNYIDLFLLIIGLYLLVKNGNYLFPILLFISPLASILTVEDSPNLHRSFYMILFIAIIEGYAISQIRHKKEILTILFISLIYFIYAYFLKSNLHIPYQKNLYIDSPTYRNVGNIELIEIINKYKNDYKNIYITNFPDNLYSWYAFLNNQNPKQFNSISLVSNTNERRFENIFFTDTKCPSDYVTESKSLVIDSGECPTETKIKDGMKGEIITKIKRSDDSVVYSIFATTN